MPFWIQYTLYAAAFVTALGVLLGVPLVIWRKVLKPGAKLISITEKMLPLLQELTTEFSGTPHAFAVLDDIVAQFRTDSGSSLRDVVNRLETTALENRAVGESLKRSVESAANRAKEEREQTQRLILALDRLTVKVEQLTIRVDAGSATSDRIEQHGAQVADELAADRARADAVAKGDDAGAAADAFARKD